MKTHGNLATSSLWQPTELARRMLGERPSPVPPTRELWPPPEPILSISTLQLAYQQNEDLSSALPSQPYVSTTVPIDCDMGPRFCTVGTNTDPPATVLSRIRSFLRRDNNFISSPPSMQLSVMKTETQLEQNSENSTYRSVNGIKKVISGAKYRIAPNSEKLDSPKIIYDTSKPGDRMFATFGANNSRKWFRLPTRTECSRHFRTLQQLCCQRSPNSSHRQPPRPPLQITQV
ncbi:unnamed protein product [Euphydryas editha]|uniref:Uncharacterized protein n=1 Tax=Euphydryas editha TaxID=104508 RepID=A0AAU9UE25_EUPED|nr:unnamed protein product [Euphydryas editha]